MVRNWVLGTALAMGVAVSSPAAVIAAEAALMARAEVQTYRVRLEAYYVGTFVESREVSFSASNELEFRIAVGNAQAVFGQSLNERGKRWNRISFVLLSVE
jgi:hypothetical protein